MKRNAYPKRSWLQAGLPLAWIVVLLMAPYLVAADTASSPDGPADGPIAQDVRFSEVTLESFTAVWTEDRILVGWQTGIEVNNAGFNLYRIDPASRYSMRLNAKLILSETRSGSDGTTYRFIDLSGVAGEAYDYWLEFVDLQGLTHYLATTSLREARYRLFLPSIHG